MMNVILTNKPNKRVVIEQFIRSRGIDNFIIFTEATEIGELLNDMMTTSTDAFNLHVFDFFGDISLTNAIRDYRDQINSLRIYVCSIEDARPYLTISDDVYVLPNEYNIMAYFWDSEACKAKNVMAFDLTHKDYIKINAPNNMGKTNSLNIDITTQNVALKYKTASGSIVTSQGPQIVVNCRAKVSDVKSVFDTRRQRDVYNHANRDLSDMPTSPVEEETQQVQVFSKPETVVPSAKATVSTKKETSDKKSNGFTSFFAKLREKPEEHIIPEIDKSVATNLFEDKIEEDVPAEDILTTSDQTIDTVQETPKEKQEKKIQGSAVKREEKPGVYIGFSNVKGGTQVSAGRASAHRFSLADVYDSISQYCIEKGYISAEDGSALVREVEGKASKDALFGNLALERNLITEEQLIEAVTEVNHIEILTWSTISEMELDFTYFSRDKCKEFRFFKLKDKYDSDCAQIVCAFSITSIHPEVKRLFDSPRICYTLDSYIDRKLEEVSL